MKINVLAVGKLSADLQSVAQNYLKMLSKYVSVEVSEIKEEPIRGKESPALIDRALNSEGEKFLARINEKDYVYVLTPEGESFTSLAFSEHLEQAFLKGQSQVVFVIGSSNGLSEAVKKRANKVLSFSKFTFPHQLFRIMLLEQIFRAFKIKNNEVYHK